MCWHTQSVTALCVSSNLCCCTMVTLIHISLLIVTCVFHDVYDVHTSRYWHSIILCKHRNDWMSINVWVTSDMFHPFVVQSKNIWQWIVILTRTKLVITLIEKYVNAVFVGECSLTIASSLLETISSLKHLFCTLPAINHCQGLSTTCS